MMSQPVKGQKGNSPSPIRLRESYADRWLAPARDLLHMDAASGVVLLLATAVALYLANSQWSYEFLSIWKTKLAFQIGDFIHRDTVGHFIINDGLMTIFFFVVGLEIKREIVLGELRDPRKALLPIVAAAGGMLVPAGIYLAFHRGLPSQDGWAIPMATDIAFVVGVMSLFGARVPFGLKIMLLSLAIIDDLGAVLVIALVFNKSLAVEWLAVAGGGLLVSILLNLIGVRRVGIYMLIGVVVWFGFLKGGIHPTVAGVLLGLLTPSKAWLGDEHIAEAMAAMKTGGTGGAGAGPDRESHARTRRIEFAIRESISPLHRLELALHPWVAFVIMPLFALANAGVALDPSGLTHPVSIGVALGLLIGKPLGVFVFSFLAIQVGATRLPTGVTWRVLFGGACLTGIGFTMALFINGLSFTTTTRYEVAGKIGVLVGSLASAILGSLILLTAPKAEAKPAK
jgi:NhaA family Na+:H+ antiporter